MSDKEANEMENDQGHDESLPEHASQDELLKELNEAQAALDEQRDAVLRARAEVENMRRRAAEDVKKAHKFGNEKLVKELLPVVDSLERCLEANTDNAEEAVKNLFQGVELTYQMFLQALEKIDAEQVNPLHDDFDPALHEAIAKEEGGKDVKSGSIIKVLQRGYTLSGRLIRPALVVVAN